MFFFLWQVVTPRIFSLVCFRIAAVDNDDEKTCNNLNRSLLDAVNSSGKLFISHTVSISLFCSSFILLDNVVKLRCIYIYVFCFRGKQSLSGKFVLRLAIGAPLTEEKHVMDAWKVIQEEASFLLASQVK